MKKYLILSFMSISICISNVYALSNTPYLNFSGIGTCYKDCEEGGYIEFNWKNKPTMFRFMRTLSENKDNIINNRFYKQYNFKNKIKKVKKKYKFLFLYKNDIANNFDRIKYNNYKSNYVNYKGIYILDNNDICVGYCLIEKAYFGHHKDAVELSQIKSLNKSTNFLKNKIQIYEKKATRDQPGWLLKLYLDQYSVMLYDCSWLSEHPREDPEPVF